MVLKVMTMEELRLDVLIEPLPTGQTVTECVAGMGSLFRLITGIGAGIWLRISTGWRTGRGARELLR